MEKSQYTPESRAVFIVDGLRTPFLKFKGVPGDFTAAELALGAAKPLLARQSFLPDTFDHVIVGCVNPSEEETNIARIVALRLGCGNRMPAFTVQRNCGSGLQAIDSALQLIQLGEADLILAGGVEAMSHAPLLFTRNMATWLGKFQKAKTFPQRLKSLSALRLHYFVPVIALLKGLTDPIVNLNMGQTAEELAFLFGISRQDMDSYAVKSHLSIAKALELNQLDEITPIYSTRGDVFECDDGIREDSSIEKLAKLKPAFEKYGSITAGNSSQISDGAAFLILASEKAVQEHQLPVLGKIVDMAWAALSPAIMGLGPVHAMTTIMMRQNVSIEDIDFFEINEAFAAQVLACVKAWDDEIYCREALGLKQKMGKIPDEKLNPDGGSIAIGHPVGASGARLPLHAVKRLNLQKGTRAMVSLCIGGGQGGAILVERVNKV